MRETETDWVTLRLDAAKHAQPVSDAIVQVIKAQMHGLMSERSLRASELDRIANSLLILANTPTEGREAP
jgi:hypothetical protein